MAKHERIVDTRGGAAPEPNWRFGITADIPRPAIPELTEGLDYYAREHRGGSYFYPDYAKKTMAMAFEWYLRYRGRPFGYRVGIQFWVDEGSLERIGAYVLYGPDHPRNGQEPKFSKSEEVRFQKKIIGVLKNTTNWRTRLKLQTFFTVHYLELHHSRAIHTIAHIPALNAYLMPTVLMGKENTPVSAVIQSIPARFKEEARGLAGRGFGTLCALLTLVTGDHHHGYRSTLGRTPLKQFLPRMNPAPSVENVYPKAKFKLVASNSPKFPMQGLEAAARCLGLLDDRERSAFDRSLFAHYVTKDLLNKKLTTISAVALIAALKPLREIVKCGGKISCDKCGTLKLQHDLAGEASSLASSLAESFGLKQGDDRRKKLENTVKAVYRTQRSSFVHDAIFRHGEFDGRDPVVFPSRERAISKKLEHRNQLLTLTFLARRAILEHLHRLTEQRFDPSLFGIPAEKFQATVGAMAFYVVGSKYWTQIRAMGRMNPDE